MSDLQKSQVASAAVERHQEGESQTAQEYIAQQLQLEADAKEALPYQFDTCTKPLGPLRQSLFSCLTCSPPPASPDSSYTPAGVCYSCSISCHGEHELVELFSKRDFECDCGTTRLPSTSSCSLRSHPTTGVKGNVTGESARPSNTYNHNFKGRFCVCGDVYDPVKEKGTMFQCLGLGSVEEGGCGEDWWHPECLLGLPRAASGVEGNAVIEQTNGSPNGDDGEQAGSDEERAAVGTVPAEETALPMGFPAEDDFDHLLCYKCVESQPWTKPYADTPGFLPAVPAGSSASVGSSSNAKRKLEELEAEQPLKKTKTEAQLVDDGRNQPSLVAEEESAKQTTSPAKHNALPAAPAQAYSLFMKGDFREHLCRCPMCFPRLSRFPQLLEEEEAYEPPVSESDPGDAGGGSVGSRSLLDRGEAALSTMDRMRAIEGVMAYNHLKDKVKSFLQPFADSGQTVGAEDVKAYFARLRGDEDAMRQAAHTSHDGASGDGSRREQSGY